MRFFVGNSCFLGFFLFSLMFSVGLGAAPANVPATPLVKFDFLGIDQGLSQSSVTAIAEDRHGFMWFGTVDGLDRYDGYRFKRFEHKDTEKSSLADNFVRALYYDSRDRLWIATKNGLSRYNEQQENFTNFWSRGTDAQSLWDDEVWSIYEDRQQRIWISTATGLQRFDEATQQFQRLTFKLGSASFSPVEIKAIFQDGPDRFWFASYSGESYLYLESSHQLFALNRSNPAGIIIDTNGINDIVAISPRQLLVLHNDGILLVTDGQSRSLLRQGSDSNLMYKKALWDAKSRILLVATSDGLQKFTLGEDARLTLQSTYVTGQALYSLFRDRNGTLWLGTQNSGVARHTLQSERFIHLSDANGVLPDADVWSMVQSTDGALWLAGSSARLARYDRASQRVSYHDVGIDGPKTLALDAQSRLYLASQFGLYRFDIGLDNLVDSREQLSDRHISSISIDNSFVYFGTWGEGVYRLPLNGPSKAEAIPLMYQSRAYQAITTIAHHGNKLYVGTAGGLIVYDLHLKQTQKLSVLEDKRINVIDVSDKGAYIGTGRNGIYVFDLDEAGTLVEPVNRLENETVYALQVEGNGNIWVSSNNGLAVVNASEIRRFDLSDGLQSMEFHEASSWQSPDGTLYFGGVDGLNIVEPQRLAVEENIASPLRFTEFSVFNNPVAIDPVDPDARLTSSISFVSDVTLAYSDYPFSFQFALVNYPQPAQIRYRYRMVGVDPQWIYSTTNRSATYTNLSFGNYRFEVEAVAGEKLLTVGKTQLAVQILRPVWLSNWALVGYLLAMLGIITLINRHLRQRRLTQKQVVESEERLKLSLWGSGDEMWDWDIQNDRMYRSNTWGTLNYPDRQEDAKGNIHPKDRDRVRQALQRHLSGETEHFEASYRVKGKRDQWLWILDRAKVVERGDNDEALRMTGTIKDISRLKETENKLNLQANAIANISDAMYIMDLKYRVVEVNKALLDITGYSREQLIGSDQLFADYGDDHLAQIKRSLQQQGGWQGEIACRRRNGSQYLAELKFDAIYDDDGEVSNYVAVFSDITRRKKTEEELRTLSNIDPLTKLPNRSYFQFTHRNLVRRQLAHSLLVFDLDNFKRINDSLGHAQGDKLLCQVAERIDQLVSSQHSLCRLGGDEFAILLEVRDLSVISQVAFDIGQALQQPFRLSDDELVIGCSVGIASYPEDGTSAEALLQNADTAMYHAKNKGGQGYQFYSQSMNADAVRRLHVETLIRQGLKDDLFEVFYQPKIHLASGELTGMEALVRLNHPEHGMISPIEFIPLAEDTGLIIEIGEIVLRKACFAAQHWRQLGIFSGRVAVNLASKQFALKDLRTRIQNVLQLTQLPAQHLELEITEGTVIDKPELAIGTMQVLSDMGIHLALDDFGTGYSSLSYLKRFPIHTLKIDKAFIDDLAGEDKGRNMVASILSIAQNMDLSVVAEGVETASQVSILKQLQCEDVQGYFFSKPLPEAEFEMLLKSERFKTVEKVV